MSVLADGRAICAHNIAGAGCEFQRLWMAVTHADANFRLALAAVALRFWMIFVADHQALVSAGALFNRRCSVRLNVDAMELSRKPCCTGGHAVAAHVEDQAT